MKQAQDKWDFVKMHIHNLRIILYKKANIVVGFEDYPFVWI